MKIRQQTADWHMRVCVYFSLLMTAISAQSNSFPAKPAALSGNAIYDAAAGGSEFLILAMRKMRM